MIPKTLEQRVDLAKLTPDDFVLRGELRFVEASYHHCSLKPEFKLTGSDVYVPFDDLFSKGQFDKCYELIVQTPERSEVVGSGYLHRIEGGERSGDVCFGIRNMVGTQRFYDSSFPVWFDLFKKGDIPTVGKIPQPIVEGPADFIFVQVSPWHQERDAQRQRVLCDPSIRTPADGQRRTPRQERGMPSLDQLTGMTGNDVAAYFGVRDLILSEYSGMTGPIYNGRVGPSGDALYVNSETIGRSGMGVVVAIQQGIPWLLFEPSSERQKDGRLLVAVKDDRIIQPGQLTKDDVRYSYLVRESPFCDSIIAAYNLGK